MENFDYVIIEESFPFYLDDRDAQKKIKTYVKKNFVLEKKQFYEDKILVNMEKQLTYEYDEADDDDDDDDFFD